MKKVDPIKVKILDGNAIIPSRAHDNDTGIDVTPNRLAKRVDAKTFLLGTGIAVKPPKGYYIDFVPRSSITKKQVMMANSFGVIDIDYRGELLIAIKLDDSMVNYMELIGSPLCQIVLRPLIIADIEIVEDLDATVRGEGGFGSTDNDSKD